MMKKKSLHHPPYSHLPLKPLKYQFCMYGTRRQLTCKEKRKQNLIKIKN